jgi:hypothetical protein
MLAAAQDGVCALRVMDADVRIKLDGRGGTA